MWSISARVFERASVGKEISIAAKIASPYWRKSVIPGPQPAQIAALKFPSQQEALARSLSAPISARVRSSHSLYCSINSMLTL